MLVFRLKDLWALFWIPIGLNTDPNPDPAFEVNTDLDPNPDPDPALEVNTDPDPGSFMTNI